MGRLYLLGACALACAVAIMTLAVPARAGGDQPMTWSKHQWRSDLFDSYPLRPRYHRVRIVTHVVYLKGRSGAVRVVPAAPVPARPLLIRGGRPVAQAQAAHPAACSGMLVLTWDGSRARRSCRQA